MEDYFDEQEDEREFLARCERRRQMRLERQSRLRRRRLIKRYLYLGLFAVLLISVTLVIKAVRKPRPRIRRWIYNRQSPSYRPMSRIYPNGKKNRRKRKKSHQKPKKKALFMRLYLPTIPPALQAPKSSAQTPFWWMKAKTSLWLPRVRRSGSIPPP